MSFQYVPSLFRIPEIPNFDPPNGIWRGRGADEGLFSLKSSYGWGYHLIVREENLCYRLVFDGDEMRPVFSDINGYIWWEGRWNAYYTRSYGWVVCQSFAGYEPLESYEWEDEGRTYRRQGDRFYTFNPPTTSGQEITAYAHGSLQEGADKTVTAVWPRWVAKNGEFGVYEGTDGETGEKVKGLPRFSGNGEQFVRSLNKENGNFTYGRIRCVYGKWVIGEVGSAGGWHEGSEPDPGGSVTFRFVKPEGSEAVGSDFTVSPNGYVCGDETEAAFLGSAAIWR